MNKYLVLMSFISIFYYLLKKDRVYVIPMILLIYSNLNGLLDWEDFALHGVIKFQDYGLLITIALLFWFTISKQKKPLKYEKSVQKSSLYKIIILYWAYYFFELIYSFLLQEEVLWPLKMSRGFFYGLIMFLIFKLIKLNPIIAFEKIIFSLKIITLLYGFLYVMYNISGWNIYPKIAYEEFQVIGITSDIKRNFSGFPTFTYYFIILFTSALLQGNQFKLINLGGVLLLTSCVFFTLTRGMLLLTIAIICLTITLNLNGRKNILRLSIILTIIFFLLPIFPALAPGQFEVMTTRFDEFSVSGITGAGNFVVRADEFSNIINNVLDFNPLFGFGFTHIEELNLGYHSSVLFGGSADNGYSNLIGTTGFIGLGLFLLLIIFWVKTNLKLQALNMESYSKINFIYIFFMLAAFLDGATFSYIRSFALFISYDLFAYYYLRKKILLKRLSSSS